jgi:hypothetical protein
MMRRAPVVHIYHGSEENKQYKENDHRAENSLGIYK